jgi:hypothetical protein
MTPKTPEVADVATNPHPVPASEADWLVTRPEGELPTVLDPAGPQAGGYPVDPRPVPKGGQGNPDATDPASDYIGRPA